MPEEDDSITRPFLKARKRVCEATSFDDQRDELGHMLDELFRMIELRGGVARLGKYNTSSVVGKPCLDTVNRAFDEVSMLPPI